MARRRENPREYYSSTDERRAKRQERKKRQKRMKTVALLLAVCIVVIGAGFAISAVKAGPASSDQTAENQPTKTVITVGNTGDIILHTPIYRTSAYKVDGDYDFSSCFNYVSSAYQAVDYMTVNLETTLPGKGTAYLGYPLFRSPDSIAFSLVNAGADLLLLANNHIYDSGKSGFLRTSQFLAEQGIDYTGAQHSDEGKKYLIKDINGVKIGFINYTYETPTSSGKAVNANPVDPSVAPYLNSFNPDRLDDFYSEMIDVLNAMEEEGVDFTIVYPHWGNEYQLEACSYQKEMAQKLCDMGVDAIIGGHPHVVQPVDVLTSSDGKHQMFCAYSVGNQLSNQRRNLMNLSTGHTEDGLIVNLEITKTSQGRVALTGVEYVPTWVYKSSGGIYYILPLNDIANLESLTGISGVTGQAQASYDRTWGIIGSGAQKVIDSYGFQ